MEPGKIYVKLLPGRDRPAFVRKKKTTETTFNLDSLVRAFKSFPLPSLRYKPRERSEKRILISSQSVGSALTCHRDTILASNVAAPSFSEREYALKSPRRSRTRAVVAPLGIEPTRPSTSHICKFCGRIRSPRYHMRHPVPDGEVPAPSICGRCIRYETSSDDSAAELRRPFRSHQRRSDSSEDKKWRRLFKRGGVSFLSDRRPDKVVSYVPSRRRYHHNHDDQRRSSHRYRLQGRSASLSEVVPIRRRARSRTFRGRSTVDSATSSEEDSTSSFKPAPRSVRATSRPGSGIYYSDDDDDDDDEEFEPRPQRTRFSRIVRAYSDERPPSDLAENQLRRSSRRSRRGSSIVPGEDDYAPARTSRVSYRESLADEPLPYRRSVHSLPRDSLAEISPSRMSGRGTSRPQFDEDECSLLRRGRPPVARRYDCDAGRPSHRSISQGVRYIEAPPDDAVDRFSQRGRHYEDI